MRLIYSKESKGNSKYVMFWISMGNQLSKVQFDTKDEVIRQYKWLKKLNPKINYIAIYSSMEIVE